MCIYHKVITIVQELKKDPSKDKIKNAETTEKLSSQEKMLRGKQQAQQRLDLVNQLTAYVSTYSNTVLAYIKIFQEVAILLEAVMMMMMMVMMMSMMGMMGMMMAIVSMMGMMMMSIMVMVVVVIMIIIMITTMMITTMMIRSIMIFICYFQQSIGAVKEVTSEIGFRDHLEVSSLSVSIINRLHCPYISFMHACYLTISLPLHIIHAYYTVLTYHSFIHAYNLTTDECDTDHLSW